MRHVRGSPDRPRGFAVVPQLHAGLVLGVAKQEGAMTPVDTDVHARRWWPRRSRHAQDVEAWRAKENADAPEEGSDVGVGVADDSDADRPRIRCPLCMWRPGAHDRWMCYCGCSWNTFDTGGVCPDCGFRHEHTMCLECTKWSKHSAWYVGRE
jgi:hypothetical protein